MAKLVDPWGEVIEAAEQHCPLPVLDGVPERADTDKMTREASRLYLDREHDALLARLKDHLARQPPTWTTIPAYFYTLRGFLAAVFADAREPEDPDVLDPEAAERVLAAVTDWRRRSGDDPDLMVLEAETWRVAAEAWRGDEFASEVAPREWEGMERALGISETILQDIPLKDRGILWTRSRFSSAVIDCETDAAGLEARFNAAVAQAPDDPDLYFRRAFSLLPRWYGDYDIFDDFARASAKRTEASRGMSLYGDIYLSVSNYEDLFEDTKCDWSLMKRGFEDWLSMRKCSWTAMMAARSAWQFEDWDYAKSLFERGLAREIRPGCLPVREFYVLWAMLFMGVEKARFQPAI